MKMLSPPQSVAFSCRCPECIPLLHKGTVINGDTTSYQGVLTVTSQKASKRGQ